MHKTSRIEHMKGLAQSGLILALIIGLVLLLWIVPEIAGIVEGEGWGTLGAIVATVVWHRSRDSGILQREYVVKGSTPLRFRNYLLSVSLPLAVSFVGSAALAQVAGSAVIQEQTRVLEASLPKDVRVFPDDRVAGITFDGGEPLVSRDKPATTSTYEIQYATAADNFTDPARVHTLFAADNRRDLQPLENGVSYVVRVRALDRWGNKTEWTPPITFTCDSKRVDALKAKCTAFFDDFNDLAFAGKDLDPLKWSNGYTISATPELSHSFINNQFHAHNMTATRFSDRAFVVNRPNVPFSNREGETNSIYFDMDGAAGGRHAWYLDLFPEPMDTYPLLALTPEASPLSRGIRITQEGEILQVHQITAAQVKPISCGFAKLRWSRPFFRRTANFRQPWRIDVSRKEIRIYVNDALRLTAPVNITWDRSWIHWVNFAYNTPKAGVPEFFLHWDNFGFTGPAPDSVRYNYYAEERMGTEISDIAKRYVTSQRPDSVLIKVPEGAQGASAARLFFTINLRPNRATPYRASAEQKVEINGKIIPVNPPDDNFRSMVLDIPPGIIQKGDNTLSFALNKTYCFNPHIEVEWPKNAAPSYSNPCAVWANCAVRTIPTVGPVVGMESILAGETRLTANSTKGTQGMDVSGVIRVKARVSNDRAMNATGNPCLFDRVQLLIDSQVAGEAAINPKQGVGSGSYTFLLDTRKLSNGPHRLFVVAVSPSGQSSSPVGAYGKDGATDGFQTLINVQNQSPSSPAVVASRR